MRGVGGGGGIVDGMEGKVNELPGEDCYPGGVSARDIDESQGEYSEGPDPYDYPDDEDYPDNEDGDE